MGTEASDLGRKRRISCMILKHDMNPRNMGCRSGVFEMEKENDRIYEGYCYYRFRRMCKGG